MEKSIKVKDTKMHKISKPATHISYGAGPAYPDRIEEISVAEAKLILLKVKHEGDGTTIGEIMNTPDKFCFTKPILISETEKIEVGDMWFNVKNPDFIHYSATEQEVMIINSQYKESCKKILALPEHFSPKHLQAIVDGKLKDGDKVLVQCEDEKLGNLTINPNTWDEHEVMQTGSNKIIKLNSSNHITLYRKEKPTVEYETSLGVGDGTGNMFVHGSYEAIKLLQDKLLRMEKMYTKQDISQLLDKLKRDIISKFGCDYFHFKKEWFDENVK